MSVKSLIPGIFGAVLVACSGEGYVPAKEITVNLSVANLPSTIEIDKSTTTAGRTEYWWGVTFDANKDGLINQGDIQLGLIHVKSASGTPQTVNVDSLQPGLYEYQDASNVSRVSGVSLQLEISGNTIRMTVRKNAYNTLQDIDTATQVYFTSIGIDDADTQHKDYHPAEDTLIDIPTDGVFTDPSDDVETSNLPHIDLISMELVID